MRDFLLGKKWLEALVDRLDDQGKSVDEIMLATNAWAERVTVYILYLEKEGYSVADTVRIVNTAVEQADFDLSKMPIIP